MQSKQSKKISRFSGLVLALMLLFALSIQVSAAQTAASASCKLLDGNTIQYTASFSGTPSTSDGMLYLYQLKTYEYAVPAGAAPVASCAVSANPTMTFSLDSKAADGRLYAKFALGDKSGQLLAVPQYITNPEVLATHNVSRNRVTKTTQDDSMTNVLLTGTGKGNVPPAAVNSTLQILCQNQSVVAHPYARGAIADTHPIHHQYYMLNGAEDAGIAALVSELQYYAAGSNATDFIIGNEMNERIWNYMAWVDWDTYVKEYTQAFRVCYTAIKSVNANANVYISLDQNWDRNRPAGHQEYYTFIDGKDFLEKFNATVTAGGNIDWCVGVHPYTVPLTNAKFWDMTGVADGAYCKSQVDQDKMVSFQNIGVFTSFLAQPAYLNTKGQVRDIIINEIGLSATQGDEVQAAAICASYQAFKRNPYITQYMYLSNLGDGVDSRLSGKALEVYNALGTPQEESYMEWAKSYIGISDWSQILK